MQIQNIKDKLDESAKKQISCIAVLFLESIICTCIFSKAYGFGIDEILRNVLTAILGTAVILFLWKDSCVRNLISKADRGFLNSFFIIYAGTFLAAMLFPLVNVMLWPYMPIFVLLSLFSNPLIGIFSASFIMQMSFLLTNTARYDAFFMYMIAGVVAIALFRNVGDKLQYGLPIAAALSVLFILLVGYYVLSLNASFSITLFIIPVINVIISTIILLILLSAYSLYVIRGGNDMYMDINDPEFELLVKLKEKDKREYYVAIHTAYLAERIAADIELNRRSIKSCSYYHNIGMIAKENTLNSALDLYEEYKFPKEATELLLEYIKVGSSKPQSKEATVVNLCEDIVRNIMAIFAHDKTAKPDTDLLIDEMFEKKEMYGTLKNSDLTIAQLERVKVLLKKEKLYYDFLR